METYQTAGRLVIRRPCPVVSGENFLSVTLGGQRNGQRWNFFTFYKRLRIVNEARFVNEGLVLDLS